MGSGGVRSGGDLTIPWWGVGIAGNVPPGVQPGPRAHPLPGQSWASHLPHHPAASSQVPRAHGHFSTLVSGGPQARVQTHWP